MEDGVIVRRGLLKKNAAVDYKVWQWKTNLEETRKPLRVTKSEVQAFAVEAYNRAGLTDFKASNGWYRRWRVRWQHPDVVRTKGVTKVKKAINPGDTKLDTQNNIKAISDKVLSIKKTKLCKQQLTNINDEVTVDQKSEEAFRPRRNVKPALDLSSDIKTGLCFIKDNLNNKVDCSKFPNILGHVSATNIDFPQCDQSVPDKESCGTSSFTEEIVNQEIVSHSTPRLAEGNNLSIYTGLGRNMLEDSFVPESTNTSDLVSSRCSNMNSNPCQDSTMAEPQCFETDQINYIVDGSVPFLSNLPSLPNVETILLKIENNTDQTISFHLGDKISVDNKRESSDVESVWALENNATSTSQKEYFIASQADRGISLPSTSASFETCSLTSPLFDQNDLDFDDHELFCDSCDDFHPRNQSQLTHCCKHRRDAEHNSLLSCVFEKKNLSTINLSPGKTQGEHFRKKVMCVADQCESQLKNPNVMMPKGKRYLVAFKSKVVNYALNHNAKQATLKFKVNRETVSKWLSERKMFSVNSPKPTVIKDMSLPEDAEFLAWLEDSKFNLTNELIRQKTSEWLLTAEGRKCHWLRLYAHRLNGLEHLSLKTRYIVYPDTFKRVAVFHAQMHSIMAAARVFGVARRRIAEWQNISSGDAKQKRASTSAKNLTDEAVDKQVFEWYCDQETPPSGSQVRCKAVELYRAAGHHSILCGPQWYYRWRARHRLPPPRSQLYSDERLLSWALTRLDNNQCVTHNELAAHAQTLGHTKVSRGWPFRFCRKHHKLLQTVPEPATPLPPSMEMEVSGFRQALCEAVATGGFTDTHIVAMDEVPLHFLPKDQKKQLLVRRTGFESCQASLVVSCLADGTLLPSMFIFKENTPLGKSDPRVISTVSETGLITPEIMEQWLQQVCFKQLPKVGGVLITDCYEVHTSEEIQEVLASHNVHHAVIPGGCAFKLLPLVAVGQMFKSMVEDLCHLSIATQTRMPLQSPAADQFYLWALCVHKDLAKHQKENLKTAFKEMLFQTSSQDQCGTM